MSFPIRRTRINRASSEPESSENSISHGTVLITSTQIHTDVKYLTTLICIEFTLIPRYWKPVTKFKTMSTVKKATTNHAQYDGTSAPENARVSGTAKVSNPMMRSER